MSKSKKKQKQNTDNQVEVITLEQTTNKVEKILTIILTGLALISFGLISIVNLFETSVIDPSNYAGEKILYQFDLVFLNIIVILLFGFVIYKLNKLYSLFSKINMRYMYIAMSAFVLIMGFIWINSVTSVPAADSANIFVTATQVAQNNYTSLHDGNTFYNHDMYDNICYYSYYPFQLGIVFVSEIIYRIFGTSSSMPFQYINVICVALAYVGIGFISKRLFKRKSVEFITICLLILCLQPILFCSFAYGNIIGMCCGIWASYFIIRYFQDNKYLLIIPAGLLLILATLAKYNNMIYLVAFAVMLIVHTIKKKKWQSIVIALILCVATVGANNLVVLSYEARANTKFKDGISQTMYLNMGLKESSMAPGWFNWSTITIYKDNNFDTDASTKQASKELSETLSKFTSDPGYAFTFLGQKAISQWCEPTYESVWVSKVKSHTNPVNALGNAVYDGGLGSFLNEYFNQYIQILMLAFGIGLFLLLKKKIANIENVLLILVLLGAFGYHLLFEGKSQYILTYIILFIPTASFAINTLLVDGKTKIHNLVAKLKKS